MAEWIRAILFSLAVALFLSFVGAFGTIQFPLLQRTLFFAFVGLGSGVVVAACIAISQLIASLRTRPVMRRAFVGLAVGPLTGLWLWLAIGYAFMHGPQPRYLPSFLFYSLLMAAPRFTPSRPKTITCAFTPPGAPT